MNSNIAGMPSQDEMQQPGINPASQDIEQEPKQEVQNEVAFAATNLAKGLDADTLVKISDQCKRGYETDITSRSEWEDNLDEWTRLASQIKEEKSYPWPGASNVKYPILSTAAMQFAARAYPSLVPSNGKVVNAVVIGKDADGKKFEKAERVSKYMSYQLLDDMEGWEEDMDRMLMMLPIVGCMFKKTWYDKEDDKVKSQLILPKSIVVNYWTKNLRECERISEIVYMSKRQLKEKQNAEIFLDVDLGEPSTVSKNNDETNFVTHDDTTPYTIIEQHTYYDLDDDGYAEPFIVTFEETTGKILRIQPRYRIEDVEHKPNGKDILRIKAMQMYTKFGFVPNPDGSFYDIGFGLLLGPINESVNTLINLLVDSGHIHNLQSGFIGKGLRIKMGDAGFKPGEWKPVNATGDDLRKQIVPLPTKEPSSVLFQLMGTLITSGKELASVAEIFTGKMPGQNTPATTTMATVEQGMKVFTAVYKRIFRALAEEFNKVYDLNALYLDPNTYINILDTQIGPDDFNRESCDIEPGADPTATTQTEKLMKAQGLMELLQMAGPMLNPVKVLSRILDAQEQPNWQELFSDQVQQTGQVPPAPPDPKVMAIQAKMQADQAKTALDAQAKQQSMELDSRSAEQKMAQAAQEHALQMSIEQDKAHMQAASELGKANVNIASAQAQAQQKVVQGAQMHQQKMQQAKELSSVKSQGTASKNGSKAK
jgi:chaperonin GroES